MKNNYDYNDNELLSLLPEDEENIKNIFYEKYGYLIDVLVNKYYDVIKMFQVDKQELRCEASYGFSDGLNCYKDNKSTSLKTFLTLCIERRITKYLAKNTTNKAKMLNEALSLEYNDEENGSIANVISDNKNIDPLNNLTEIEFIEETIKLAKENLSPLEYEVFTYLINDQNYIEIASILNKSPKQIDNTIQRLKIKMRKIIESIKQ